MNGRPVWLASISRRDRRGEIIPTVLWTKPTMAESLALLRRMLGPCGDPTAERAFRMNITVCLHRALSTEDIERLPGWFCTAEPVDLAGGPVAILEETVVGLPTTRPCHAPVKHYPRGITNPLLWVPIDCERCEPCRARLALQEERDRQTGATPSYLSDMLMEGV